MHNCVCSPAGLYSLAAYVCSTHLHAVCPIQSTVCSLCYCRMCSQMYMSQMQWKSHWNCKGVLLHLVSYSRSFALCICCVYVGKAVLKTYQSFPCSYIGCTWHVSIYSCFSSYPLVVQLQLEFSNRTHFCCCCSRPSVYEVMYTQWHLE